jgi:hypothetical protein
MLGGVVVVAFAISASPAGAAPKTSPSIGASPSLELSSQSRRQVRRYRRARTHITVRRRSYLDPGTESIPGESKDLDYAFPVGQTSRQVLTGPAAPAGWQNPGWPLPGPYHPWPP